MLVPILADNCLHLLIFLYYLIQTLRYINLYKLYPQLAIKLDLSVFEKYLTHPLLTRTKNQKITTCVTYYIHEVSEAARANLELVSIGPIRTNKKKVGF